MIEDILVSLSIIGLVLSVVLAVKNTPSALSLIDDVVYERYENETNSAIPFYIWLGVTEVDGKYTWDDRSKMLTVKEIIKLTWICYIPTAITSIITIICLILCIFL